MGRELDQDELIDRWTLVADELALVAGKRGATRLGLVSSVLLVAVFGPITMVLYRNNK